MPEHSGLTITSPQNDQPQSISIPYITNWKPKVAITSLKVEDDEWQHAVDGNPLLTLKRYRRLAHLLDAIIEARPRPNCVVLPEFCLPIGWAIMMVSKLVGYNISVIAGLGYRHDTVNPHELHNEVLITLISNYPS